MKSATPIKILRISSSITFDGDSYHPLLVFLSEYHHLCAMNITKTLAQEDRAARNTEAGADCPTHLQHHSENHSATKSQWPLVLQQMAGNHVPRLPCQEWRELSETLRTGIWWN